MSILDTINELNIEDEAFFEHVLRIGSLKDFDPDIRLVMPTRFRPAFLISLLSFKQVYVLTKSSSYDDEHLTFEKLRAPGDSASTLQISKDDEVGQHTLIHQLVDLGYTRADSVFDVGQFAIRGGAVDVFPVDSELPVVIDYFGDEVESITEYIVDGHGLISELDKISFGSVTREDKSISSYDNVLKTHTNDDKELHSSGIFATSNGLAILLDPEQINPELDVEYIKLIKRLKKFNIPTISISAFGNKSNQVQVTAIGKINQLEEELSETKLGERLEMLLNAVSGKRNSGRNSKPKRDPLDVNSLEIGDYLVHDLHGIGKYVGKEMRENRYSLDDLGNPSVDEYLVIEYSSSVRASKGSSKMADYLYVATSNPLNLARYVGADSPKLSKFGGVDFAKIKARAKKYTKDVARELIKIYASRVNSDGFAFIDGEGLLHEMEADFTYELTPDQAAAITAVKADMEASHPMDRLICGDVGFGKTEVALRAAFKAVLSRKQVAVLVPTTILASQHFETFTSRLSKFGVNVALLTRFVSQKDRKTALERAKNGQVDIIIGTHSLLTPKVQFSDLGLVIVDEEQRFGTMHKEMLKVLNARVDVLSMSATPIPRTLEMSLTGIRDISTIATPPKGRRPIITNVLESSDELLVDAIRTEIERGGQVFLIHNNVNTLSSVQSKIQEMLPDARLATAHGKMTEARIDRVIDDFWHERIDVLICTTIVETGLDIPNANTLIVNKAENFGLTQLHQLRGRVGRNAGQAYAYFFYSGGKVLTEHATKRLETIQDFSDLGAGTAIALKDLEMRGAGNFIGQEQSGHIIGVGYEMYIRLMNYAIENLKRS